MNEWNTFENRREEQRDLEERLSAYYGPALPPQPLPSTSWVQLQSRLARPRSLRRRMFRRHGRKARVIRNPRFAREGMTPAYISDAFERIAHEAQLPYTSDMLRCIFKEIPGPLLHVSYWGKRKIHLLLPAHMYRPFESSELNVLLASGLATYVLLFERKVPFGFVRLLIIWGCLLALLALVLVGRQQGGGVVFPVALIILAILIGTAVLSHLRGRALAFRGDELMVQWLGRSQVCEGLHALVRRRSRLRRRGFGRVSFGERIARVCGTRVTARNEGLTLVR